MAPFGKETSNSSGLTTNIAAVTRPGPFWEAASAAWREGNDFDLDLDLDSFHPMLELTYLCLRAPRASFRDRNRNRNRSSKSQLSPAPGCEPDHSRKKLRVRRSGGLQAAVRAKGSEE